MDSGWEERSKKVEMLVETLKKEVGSTDNIVLEEKEQVSKGQRQGPIST